MIQYDEIQLTTIVNTSASLFQNDNFEEILDNFNIQQIPISFNTNTNYGIPSPFLIPPNEESYFNLFEESYLLNELLSQSRLDNGEGGWVENYENEIENGNILEGSQITFFSMYSVINQISLRVKNLANRHPVCEDLIPLDIMIRQKELLINNFNITDQDFTTHSIINNPNFGLNLLVSSLFNFNYNMYSFETASDSPRVSLSIFSSILDNFVQLVYKGRDLEIENQVLYVDRVYFLLRSYQSISNSSICSIMARLSLRQTKFYFLMNNTELNIVNDAVVMYFPSLMPI